MQLQKNPCCYIAQPTGKPKREKKTEGVDDYPYKPGTVRGLSLQCRSMSIMVDFTSVSVINGVFRTPAGIKREYINE